MKYQSWATFLDGSLTEWVYSADGTKLRTVHTTAADGVTVPMGSTVELTPDMVLHRDTTDYRGPLVIENGRLSRVLFAGGYAEIRESDKVPVYHYYTLDHVGNVRAVTREDGAVVQQTDYYPFGSVIADRGFGRAVQPHKTAGKELDMMHGLGWADFGARRYDPVLPQWTQPDPLSELAYNLTPYRYCFNNPMRYTDRNGLYEKEEEAWEASKNYNNAPVHQDRNTGEWFIALNADMTDKYTQGGTLTRFYGEKSSYNTGVFAVGTVLSYRETTQYSKELGIWRGKNGKIYEGLSGKGPNQYTGSRNLAKTKSIKIGKAAKGLTAISMYMTWKQYNNPQNQTLGPNMQHYLTNRHAIEQGLNGMGLVNVYGTALSSGYNLGYVIEEIGQWLFKNPDFRIRLNPYTMDFTPIEQTLMEYDEMGINLY